jgi:molybdopterin converting factor small subunit
MATFIIPTPLRKFTNSATKIEVPATNVSDALQQLTTSFPDLAKHLINTNGKIAPFINIFVGNDDIRNLNQEKTEVQESTIISIVPAIAGGIHHFV